MTYNSEFASLPSLHTDKKDLLQMQSTRNATEEKRPYAVRGRHNDSHVLSFGIELTFAEPDDARITGMTRSLARRLLGLNLPAFDLRRPITGLQETATYKWEETPLKYA